jgi:hypothetical protein
VSTIDEFGVCEAARAFKADGIVTLATDMQVLSVAYTCEQLGLAGISMIQLSSPQRQRRDDQGL